MESNLPAKVNFVVKSDDASAAQIKAALKQADISVRAVVEVYREKEPEKPTEDVPETEGDGARKA